ncbi:sensor domain-containing protein [Cognatilysobacter segetis]|uniref:sensor domain-containing protein n=1 Tax=Cognatilysobacter segetis TaxID=2492394 RepID=UPI00105BBE07|nr:PAS domain S-box protein [Lysobacter segetis]
MSDTPSWSIEGAFRHAAGGLALIGLDGRWLQANAAACALLGRGQDGLVGHSVLATCETEDAVALMQKLEAAVDGRLRAFQLELRVPRLDGSHSWLRMDASVVPDGDGRAAYLGVGLVDVTEQHRARSERDAFFDLCPDLLAIVAPDGTFERVNAAWATALGWHSTDLRGRPFLEFVHPDDVARTVEEAERTCAGHPTPRFRNRYRVRRGGHRWLEWHSRTGDDGRIHAIARDVTEQQQALLIFEAEMTRRRQRLDEAEQRLGVHVNNTPLAVVEFDARLRVRRWSPRAAALFGWSEEAVVGDRPDQWRFIHEDDADTVATAMLSLVTGESPSQVVHFRNYTHDARVLHCEWFMSAVFDEAGQLLSVLAFAQDVTARVQAEAEAAEREALFRVTFEQAPVGIAHVGLDGRWLRVNRTLCDFFGRSQDDLLATTFQQLTHPDDLDSDLSLLRQLLAGRIERYELRKRYLHADGRVLWAQLTVSLRRGADDAPLHFISVVEDIAATVEAEQAIRRANDDLELRVGERTRELEGANRTLAVEVEQRREAEAALRESESRIRTILENSHDAFIACDEDGNVTEWNRSAEVIFGWRRSEAIGRPMSTLIVPERLHATHDAGMARYAATGLPHVLDQRRQLVARHRSGREFPVEVTVSLVRTGGRRLFAAFLHDISERTAAERQLRESEARLRTITDNVPALIAFVDRDLHYRFANAAYRDWFGVDPAALVGRTMRDLVGERVFARIQPNALRVLAGEQIDFDVDYDCVDGVRHAHATWTPAFDAEGRVAGFYVTTQDITAHRRLAQVLEQRALRDELTGLPNRTALTQALDAGLARSEREALGAAVMFLDLDGFKQVNDTHGHDVGDEVLREFARRLRASVRAGDVVARLAGDEFVVLLEGVAAPAQAAESVARSILQALQAPFDVGGHRLAMAGSIGIAVQAAGRFDRERLLRLADEAMYTAKRNRTAHFELVEA